MTAAERRKAERAERRRRRRAEIDADLAAEPPVVYAAPGPSLLGGADRVEGEEQNDLVAFTFDDGPDPHTTPRVLDALARFRIPATFFVVNRHIVGKRGIAGLPVLARIVAEGHTLGAHTANHARLLNLDAEELRREVDESVTVLEQAAGVPVELFRPPYGDLGRDAARRVRKLGLTDVRWSIDPKDFQDKDGDRLRELVLDDLTRERGGIVLLHDTKRVTANSVALLFEDLERANCRRLLRGAPPIIPVSLHYFLRDKGVPRPVPPEVAARTDEYRRYLAEACEARRRPRGASDVPTLAAPVPAPMDVEDGPAAPAAPAPSATPVAGDAAGAAPTTTPDEARSSRRAKQAAAAAPARPR